MTELCVTLSSSEGIAFRARLARQQIKNNRNIILNFIVESFKLIWLLGVRFAWLDLNIFGLNNYMAFCDFYMYSLHFSW